MSKTEIHRKPVRPATIKRLVKKALKDKPKHIPSKGYKFLSSLKPGDRWITSTGTQGILIECNANARVIIQKAPGIAEEDRSYYLGTKIISSTTEVKEIGNVKDGMDTLSSK